MFFRSINEISRAAIMTIIGDATTWSVTSDNSRGVIYDRNIVKIQATVTKEAKFYKIATRFRIVENDDFHRQVVVQRSARE